MYKYQTDYIINFRVTFKVIETIKLSYDWECRNAKSQKRNQQKKSGNKLNYVKVIKRGNKHNKNECWWLKKKDFRIAYLLWKQNLSIKMLVV